MTDLAANDLTYAFSIRNKRYRGPSGYSARGTISFGNSTLTIPSAGIPITKGKLGLPRFVRSFKVLESSASGYLFEYDVSAETLKLLVAGTGAGTLTSNSAGTPAGNVAAPTLTLISSGADAAANAAIYAASGVLKHNVANAANITGIQAPAFTGDALGTHAHTFTGTSSGVATKFSNTTGAPAAMVLEIEAEGY